MGKFDEALHKKLQRFCDDVGEGDGLDPRYEAKKKRVQNRKALQLCAQIRDALTLTLNDSPSEVIQELVLIDVLPAPDSSQVCICITSSCPEPQVLAELAAESGRLRSEIASAIHRKKTPEVRFKVVHESTL